jgi:2-oxoglutarate ferredoxin oxidoreductase subunit alpha
LSDGFIANGSEPWKFPKAADLEKIAVEFKKELASDEETFQPYKRDEKLTRAWAIPGVAGLEHRIGGLEKEDITGNVSYDPDNHEHMVKTREAKIQMIANYIPEQTICNGENTGDVLILGWGSTFGVITTVVNKLRAEGKNISHTHLRYIKPFPKNLDVLLSSFKTIIVPEINNGQLIKILKAEYLVDAKGYNKIKGNPITQAELEEFVVQYV